VIGIWEKSEEWSRSFSHTLAIYPPYSGLLRRFTSSLNARNADRKMSKDSRGMELRGRKVWMDILLRY
jgi:hypothetical protein